jgi:hypothetical protein
VVYPTGISTERHLVLPGQIGAPDVFNASSNAGDIYDPDTTGINPAARRREQYSMLEFTAAFS